MDDLSQSWRTYLRGLRQRYQHELDFNVIPFWLAHSVDHKYGGFFTCLLPNGAVFDDRKYIWLQGRGTWMFARLFNEWSSKSACLNAAQSGMDFLRQFGCAPDGTFYFSVTRDGRPYAVQRKPFSAAYYALALVEYARATAQPLLMGEAVDVFWRIREWVENPRLLGHPRLVGAVKTGDLANDFILAHLACEILRRDWDTDVLASLRRAAEKVIQHYDTEYGVFR